MNHNNPLNCRVARAISPNTFTWISTAIDVENAMPSLFGIYHMCTDACTHAE